jgi:hypothetical protein
MVCSLRIVNCIFTVTSFANHTGCTKWPPCAWIHFPTCATGERVTLTLFIRLAALRIRRSSPSVVFTLRAYNMAFMQPHTRHSNGYRSGDSGGQFYAAPRQIDQSV